jgi:hypothetical protein
VSYYYANNKNEPVGPISAEQLHALARAGTIAPDTAVWKEGTAEWQQYRSVAPPPLPPGMGTVRTAQKTSIPQTLIVQATKPKGITAKKKGCLGCAGTLIVGLIILGIVGVQQEKREFAENRDQILKQVKADADAGDYAREIELADKYNLVHDPELDKYLDVAHAALKAAEEKSETAKAQADAASKAAEDKNAIAKAEADAASKAAEEKAATATKAKEDYEELERRPAHAADAAIRSYLRLARDDDDGAHVYVAHAQNAGDLRYSVVLYAIDRDAGDQYWVQRVEWKGHVAKKVYDSSDGFEQDSLIKKDISLDQAMRVVGSRNPNIDIPDQHRHLFFVSEQRVETLEEIRGKIIEANQAAQDRATALEVRRFQDTLNEVKREHGD